MLRRCLGQISLPRCIHQLYSHALYPVQKPTIDILTANRTTCKISHDSAGLEYGMDVCPVEDCDPECILLYIGHYYRCAVKIRQAIAAAQYDVSSCYKRSLRTIALCGLQIKC